MYLNTSYVVTIYLNTPYIITIYLNTPYVVTMYLNTSYVVTIYSKGLYCLQAHHLRCLNDFIEAQLTYYAQCQQYISDLQRQLGR